MVSSVLRPEKIVGRQNTNRAAAQNFISGGSVLGASVINGAANKIVGFQRAGVRPAAPAIDSIVSTISTNINNNLTSVINNTLQGFSADYQKRIKQVDNAKPIGILGKFLNVYKTALGFINFFGNKKNIDKVRDNLEVLKKSFTESFEVAKLIRQVIIKIVKQLSNLPVASSSGGGGLNLDVDIPGGGLKKSAPRGLGRMMGGKGKMLALGAGALGLGALGAGAVNALSDSPQTQAAGTSPEIPGDTIDRFSSIVDKFANAISNLFKTGKPKPKQQPPGSSSGSGAAKPPGQTKPPGSMNTPGVTTTGEKGVLDLIASVEQGPEGYDSFNTSAGKTPGKATEKTIGWLAKNARGAIGRYQQMPQYLLERAQRAGFDENTKFTPEVQDAITLNELRKGHSLDKFLGGQITEEQFLQKLAPTWRGLPQGQINAAKLGGTADLTYQDQYAGRNAAGKTYAQTISELKNIRSGGNKPISAIQSTQVAAAPTATQMRQKIAQQVAQPPPSQQQQQPIVMPIDMSGATQQQTGGGGVSAPPSTQRNGPSVPLLPAANTDNFLVLYSRMVYNIVDG